MNTKNFPNLAAQLAIEIEDLTRGLTVGAQFVVPPSADICSSLEFFMPAVLRQRYRDWEKESLDGIFVARAIKTGHSAVQLVGSSILITDQTVTPFLVHLTASQSIDSGSVTVLQLMLGEPGTGALGISGPPCNSRDAQRLLMSLVDRVDSVEWSYTFQTDSASSSTDTSRSVRRP